MFIIRRFGNSFYNFVDSWRRWRIINNPSTTAKATTSEGQHIYPTVNISISINISIEK